VKNIYVYCEGQTEESFIKKLLYPYFLRQNLVLRPIICSTKRTPTLKFKGGVSDYGKIRRELKMLCAQHKNELVTTMFDFYGLPDNTPGLDPNISDPYEKIATAEKEIEKDIGAENLFANLVLHEFEGLLFSKTEVFSEIAEQNTVNALQIIRNSFMTPEHINDSSATAPSKRLTKLIPEYEKVSDGTILSEKIGLEQIISECRHFAEWVDKIKTYANR